MKILFVLPSGDTVYGSGRCAVQLARASGLQFDLLVGKSLIHPIDEENLRRQFGDKLGSIYQLWLPNVNFYYGENKNIFVIFAAIHKYIMWRIQKRKFRNIIQSNGYDVIHLNSLILIPMVDKKYRMILHVRKCLKEQHGNAGILRKRCLMQQRLFISTLRLEKHWEMQEQGR